MKSSSCEISFVFFRHDYVTIGQCSKKQKTEKILMAAQNPQAVRDFLTKLTDATQSLVVKQALGEFRSLYDKKFAVSSFNNT